MKLNTLVACMVGVMALSLGTGSEGSLGFSSAAAQEAVRPEIGKHLKDVQAMLKAAKYREALAKLREAEAVGGRTAGENVLIERLRLAAAQGAGDGDSMVRAYEALKAAGKVGGGENLQYLEAIAGTYSRVNENAKALTWANRYFKEGGNSAAMKAVVTRSQFMSGDMGAIIKDTVAEIHADEKAGRAPSKEKLGLLMSAAERAKDSNAYSLGLEKLLQYYPGKDVWAAAISGAQQKKGFSDRYVLDLFRLRFLSGNMRGEADYMDYSQMAAQAGFADEGLKAVEAGYAAGVLGQGASAERHKRLKDFMLKRVADAKAGFAAAEAAAKDPRDGNALIPLGLALAQRGDAKGGVKLIELGIEKGNLKNEDAAKLALGQAQLLAGEMSKAVASFRGVKGTDGSAEVARLFSIHARSKK
ncbi:hypothetical protein HNQ51_001132 [Inhella inkyongensis]|uniref:Tetratricopeptide repeat protein n=1 Tax=Inhella inkyongensis TaxID=392593 RepID=A0A840S5S3_9BURK|nr:hypothetical protein [Inhella inkyongensis]MBB5203839.1 hypothetical protein [Inhella inkyongensis]